MTRNELRLRAFEAVLSAFVSREKDMRAGDMVVSAGQISRAVADSLWRDEP